LNSITSEFLAVAAGNLIVLVEEREAAGPAEPGEVEAAVRPRLPLLGWKLMRALPLLSRWLAGSTGGRSTVRRMLRSFAICSPTWSLPLSGHGRSTRGIITGWRLVWRSPVPAQDTS
jgi:hypothetical protein